MALTALTLGPLALSGTASAAQPLGNAPVMQPTARGGSYGYWLAEPNGAVQAEGSAPTLGSEFGIPLSRPVVSIATDKSDHGYWLVGADGGVLTYGDAPFYGSTGNIPLSRPMIGLTATKNGQGYWLVASDGGVFSFGNAQFYGSTGAIALNRPVVGMAATADGKGYWLVASDGGVFSYGDAGFYGSTGNISLNQPIVSMASTPDGKGYWLLAADGGVFAFGDAGFYGSSGGNPSPDPAQKIVADRSGGGYWIVDQNGTASPFGDAGTVPPDQGLLFTPVTPGDKAVLFAFAQLGKPYIWGGNGPVGYDCSGLALASWEAGDGIGFARVANDQYATAGTPVAMTDLVAGDLVFWGTPGNWQSVYHTAIYVGGGMIVESTGDHVQLNNLDQWGTSDIMPNGRRP